MSTADGMAKKKASGPALSTTSDPRNPVINQALSSEADPGERQTAGERLFPRSQRRSRSSSAPDWGPVPAVNGPKYLYLSHHMRACPSITSDSAPIVRQGIKGRNSVNMRRHMATWHRVPCRSKLLPPPGLPPPR